MSVEDRLQRLEQNVRALLQRIEQLPSEVLYREPSPGEWPVMSTLAHVAEILPYWAQQAEAIAAHPGEPFGRTVTDPDRIAAVERHGHDSLDAAVTAIRGALETSLKTLRALPPEAWTLTGQHPTRGPMSVEQVVDSFLVNHVEDHTAQVTTALSAVSPSKA